MNNEQTSPQPNKTVLYDQDTDLSFPEHSLNQSVLDAGLSHEVTTPTQEVQPQTEATINNDSSLPNTTSIESSDPPRPVQAPIESNRKSPRRNFLNLDHILELKDTLDRTSARVLAERTFSFDKRLDKDDSRAQLVSSLKAVLIENYVQTIARGNAKDIPVKIRGKISDLMSLSYDDLEKRIAEREADRAERESKTRAVDEARKNGHSSTVMQFPKTQLDYYLDWVGDEQNPEAEADFAKYLESRPNDGPHFDANGDFVTPNRTYTNINGTALTPHDVKDDILRFYYRPRDEADYQASNAEQAYEDMSMSALAKAIGQAEIDNDRTKAGDLTDVLMDKLGMLAEKETAEGQAKAINSEDQDALLSWVIQMKEDYKNSLLPPTEASLETDAEQPAQMERDNKNDLVADARGQVDLAHRQAESKSEEPLVDPNTLNEQGTKQLPVDKQSQPELVHRQERGKKNVGLVQRAKRRLFNRSSRDEERSE